VEETSSKPSVQERIAEAAMALISERGLAGVTMSEVARHAGVARQTLYNHYADVESIVTSVIEQHERLGFDQVRRLLDGHEGAAAKLEQLIRHAVTMGAHHHAMTALEGSLSPRAQEVLRTHRNRTEGIVVEILEEGIAEGVFRQDLDPEVDAVFIREILVEGIAEEAADLPRLTGATVRFVLAAVGAPRA